MSDMKLVAEQFEQNRNSMRILAYRLVGSRAEAEDIVQEAWIRLSRANTTEIENLTGWLKTVVARICIDVLRTRRSRRETTVDAEVEALPASGNVEQELVIADSVSTAMLAILETLSPPERVAFVLHDMFDIPFENIGPILGRSVVAARQAASRGRRRIKGKSKIPEADRLRQRKIVDAFVAASQEGDFFGLLNLLDPDVIMRADAAAVAASLANVAHGAAMIEAEIVGRYRVAKTFSGRARDALPAIIDDGAALVLATKAGIYAALEFVIENDRIIEIVLSSDQRIIAGLGISGHGLGASDSGDG